MLRRAGRTAKHRLLKPRLLFFFQTLLAVTVILTFVSCEMEVTWKPSKARTLNYSVTIEKSLGSGQPVSVEQITLSLEFSGNGNVTIRHDNVVLGTFPTTPAGNLIVSDSATELPSYISLLLTGILPPDPIYASKGSSWETAFPNDKDLGTDRITIQDRYKVNMVSRDGDLLVNGDVRLIRNNALVSPLPTSSNIHRFLQWSAFLTGTAAYDQDKYAVTHAELYYVLVPEANMTSDQIRQHAFRHHAVVDMVP